MSSPNDSIIRQVLADKLRVSRDFLEDDFTLEELGLDSLTSAEIVLGVEKRAGIRLDLSALGERLSRDTKLGELIAAMSSMLDDARGPA
ncbi:MAG TPA: acyl carrier protein [Polyangiales bacterium]|nr:acyl carrier protein [Polyangiales bacterium]